MHDEHQDPLQAVEDCEDVGHGQHPFIKLKTAKDPHGAQHTQLSNGSDSECPVGGDRDLELHTTRTQIMQKGVIFKMRGCHHIVGEIPVTKKMFTYMYIKFKM